MRRCPARQRAGTMLLAPPGLQLFQCWLVGIAKHSLQRRKTCNPQKEVIEGNRAQYSFPLVPEWDKNRDRGCRGADCNANLLLLRSDVFFHDETLLCQPSPSRV